VEQRANPANFPHSCRLCALPLAAITRYLLLRLTQVRLSGDVMKYLGLAVVLFAVATAPAQAFEIHHGAQVPAEESQQGEMQQVPR
jgi:hypothetical protein